MTVREVVLFAILVGLGAHSFRHERAWTRRRLRFLRTREWRVGGEVRQLCRRQRDLRAEEVALGSDCYYVERMAREQLGWRPVLRREPVPSPVDVPTLGVEPGELAFGVPSLAPSLPAPVGPPATPAPPAPAAPPPPPRRQADGGGELLAALGYTSVNHFQQKMMRRHVTGAVDEATRRRARTMRARLAHLGFQSVREFQQRHRLTPDGIYGKRTERRVLAELRRRARRTGGAAGVVVENGRGRGHEPGG